MFLSKDSAAKTIARSAGYSWQQSVEPVETLIDVLNCKLESGKNSLIGASANLGQVKRKLYEGKYRDPRRFDYEPVTGGDIQMTGTVAFLR